MAWKRRAAAEKAVTQRELNDAYTGPEFVLAERYGAYGDECDATRPGLIRQVCLLA